MPAPPDHPVPGHPVPDHRLPDNLARAIAGACAQFPWPGPQSALTLCHCPACVSPSDARQLAQTDPHLMSVRLLAEYTNSSHGHGPVIEAEFKPMLPRYFAFLALFDPPTRSGKYPPALARLGDCDYRRRWSPREVAAVDAFFCAWLPYAAQMIAPDPGVTSSGKTRHAPDSQMSDILAMTVIAGAGADLVIRILERDHSAALSLHLAILILTRIRPHNARHRFEGEVLADYAADSALIGDWLMSHDTRARLEAAACAASDPAHQAILSAAAARVD